MGGCRCTYRNCVVKTDGKTHMFHYPVFDKVRCHQWLINARRLDFLNLKVSQLKNRVVCQYHFKDEYFMNFKKEKLTFEAIPTEDGPYCDPNTSVDNSQDYYKLNPIVLEDIENHYYSTNEKKANFSLKYIDFLTNSECEESSYLKEYNVPLTVTKVNDLPELNFVLRNNIDEKPNIINHNIDIDESDLLNHKLTSIKNNINKPQTHPMLIVPPYLEKSNIVEADIKPEYFAFNPALCRNEKSIVELETPKAKQKVRIISEKKITYPVPVTGNFKLISPSVVLNATHLNQNNTKTNEIISENTPSAEKQINITDEKTKPVTLQPQPNVIPQKSEETPKINTHEKPIYTSKESNNEKAKLSLLKSKITPERIAAIKEKREFNKKLKDVIESCVIKLEGTENANEEKLPDQTRKKNAQTSPKRGILQKDEGYLSSLEARMIRMENLLLNKIDQNSQRIMELKKTLPTSSQKKKSVSTQTYLSEEVYKKFLYNEISKYLSAESNNIIYEELFINFAQNSSSHPATKKRRRYR
ncbi:unnamed protein product [Parnassius mnemosyne]|uniref:THAP-type domain-containing protein n=1 Tax=Parnassius mnemosyne TaxID=213953 RepID=A0AAV1KCS9_9NEOP